MNKQIAIGVFLVVWLLVSWGIQKAWDYLADPPSEEDDERFE